LKTYKIDQFVTSLFSLAFLVKGYQFASAGFTHLADPEVFNSRHFEFFPVAPRWALIMIVVGFFFTALLIWLPKTKTLSTFTGTVSAFAALTQFYENTTVLILFVSFLFLLFPFWKAKTRSLAGSALRYQLMIVYGYTVAHKVQLGFQSGHSLQNVAAFLSWRDQDVFGLWGFVAESLPMASALSVAVLLGEVLAPLVLLFHFRLGFLIVAALHIGMATTIPHIFAFTFGMMILAIGFHPGYRAKAHLGSQTKT